LVYGAEVYQIPTREINKILSTEMDVLRRSARKSRMERIKNEHTKEIMGVKRKPDIIDSIEKKTPMVWPCQTDAGGENTKISFGMDTTGEKEKRMSKKNVDGRSTSSHDDKKFRTRSMEKRRNGVWFPEDDDSCYETGEIEFGNESH
jgi:hypothetical protein